MVEPIVVNLRYLAQEVSMPEEQVQSAVELFDAGLPVPFLARYRKDITRIADEERLRLIESTLKAARSLCERKMTILKTIDSQGKLTPELDTRIREARTVKRLEDLYLPFKAKRTTLAAGARTKGLEPLALDILNAAVAPDKLDERAAEFISVDKKVGSVADALLGAGYIIAEMFAEKAELFQVARENLHTHGILVTSKITGTKKEGGEVSAEGRAKREKVAADDSENGSAADLQTSSEEQKEEVKSEEEEVNEESVKSEDAEPDDNETAAETETATDTETPADEIQEITQAFQKFQEAQAEKGTPAVISQNTLKKKKKDETRKKLQEAKQRQQEHFEKQFSDYFSFSTRIRGIPAHQILAFNRAEQAKIIRVKIETDEEKTLLAVKSTCVPNEHVYEDFLTNCLKDALHRLVLPALEREIRSEMTTYGETQAVVSFGKNLRQLLLQPPVHRKRILAIDPGFKNGCKTVAIDEFGNLLAFETIFLVGNAERKARAAEKIAAMVRNYSIDLIAVGNGTGSRETAEAVAAMIEKEFADAPLSYTIVNEAGASVYSVSPAAKEEFPQYDPLLRGAVSIGRRLQDPLNELVKIDPASLGVGMYQHDIKSKHLKEKLTDVVGSCVNYVGVDVNTATPAVLTYIAGLNQLTARKIYEYRREHGPFRSREDLKSVSGFGTAAYTYSAGFLKIPDAVNPFDATRIHPESYELAAQILGKLGFTADDLRSPDKVQAITERIAAGRFGEVSMSLAAELGAGLQTVRDILDELRCPGRDPRDTLPPPVFRKNVMNIDDLTPDMEVTGTVQNIVNFGAFFDIGLHESGFVHISQMSVSFVRDAHELVSIGETVKLWVVTIDNDRKRVTCTMLPPGTEKMKYRESLHESRGERPERPPKERYEKRENAAPPADRPQRLERPVPPRSEQDRFKVRHDARRNDRKNDSPNPNREPRVFTAAAVKEAAKPISEKQKQGKEPLRSFSDLAQLLGRSGSGDSTGDKK
ncbi:MAG: helix-hairpin-helix domain-containing protein [Planctomycetaceae bacterium]|jgi:uncharacterized protein|nr:helix-hairpin-helix domain-containing protein [Planctomycetaceae bacterium]